MSLPAGTGFQTVLDTEDTPAGTQGPEAVLCDVHAEALVSSSGNTTVLKSVTSKFFYDHVPWQRALSFQAAFADPWGKVAKRSRLKKMIPNNSTSWLIRSTKARSFPYPTRELRSAHSPSSMTLSIGFLSLPMAKVQALEFVKEICFSRD
jgi:hypothetical protein